MHLAARARAGPIAGVLFGLLFAVLLLPILTIESWLGLPGQLSRGDTPKITIRQTSATGPRGPDVGQVIAARGEPISPEAAALVSDIPSAPPRTATLVGLGAALFFGGLLLFAYLRTSPRGRLARVQLTVLGGLVAFAVAAKAMLLLSSLPWLLVPTSAAAILVALVVDKYAGSAVAVAAGVLGAALLPFESPVAIVLSIQGIAAVVALGRARRRRAFLYAGFAGGLAAAAVYVGLAYLYTGHFSTDDVVDPARSALVAAFAAGPLGAILALALRAPVEALAGDIPRARLIELSDLENPLLKKIAAEAPGTWQHSLAMANMAEICANAIGANALLVRVGAYYHDLGKSLQPQYYIENLAAGQTSPHDELSPEMSADAIFAHVTEGVRLARAHKLPTPIIDFMHMHHGDGLLEYFWGKCLEEGNPGNLHPAHFRYPGVKPQSRETAILAICDAVEAASRTLHKPDARAIETVVQRIVYGKLHNGQLDESSLTVADLRRLANTLVDTLKHAHHVRIEYPWQKEERARLAAATTKMDAGPTSSPLPTMTTGPMPRPGAPAAPLSPVAPVSPVSPVSVTGTGAFVLDSADSPRPVKADPRRSRLD